MFVAFGDYFTLYNKTIFFNIIFTTLDYCGKKRRKMKTRERGKKRTLPNVFLQTWSLIFHMDAKQLLHHFFLRKILDKMCFEQKVFEVITK